MDAVKKLWKEVKRKDVEDAHKYLLETQSKVRQVIHRYPMQQPQRRMIRRTPGLTKGNGKKMRKTVGVTIARKEEPLPQHTARIVVSKSYRVADSPSLDFVPSATEEGEQAAVDEYFNMFDTEAREEAIERGAIHEAKALDSRIKRTMERSHKELHLPRDTIVQCLSQLAELEKELERVEKLYDEMKANLQKSTTKNNKASTPMTPASPSRKKQAKGGDGQSETNEVVKHSTLAGDDVEYLKLVDSFRKLYCSRCKLYDCQIHPDLTDSVNPSLQLSYELGMSLEAERAEERAAQHQEEDSARAAQDDKKNYPEGLTTLTKFHMQICRRFFLIYEGDFEQMAVAMQAPPNLIKEYVKKQRWKLPKENRVVKSKPVDRKGYYSLANYPWYKEITEAHDTFRPHFIPCVQETEEEEPACLQRRSFCTRACAWGERSKNFFRGCGCEGACNTTACTCVGNGRECSPDLCECDCCSDPTGQPSSNQRCQNDNITMRRGVDLALGRSKLPGAGWGCFSKRAIHKGEFLGEYVGEMITQIEAERRGRLYDIQKNSSLFMLSSDMALDAERKHNIFRYINHSSESPNALPRLLKVDGDSRLGFFACQDIPPQTELTFDYRYDTSFNNEFILVTEKSVPWMNEKEEKGSGKEKSTSKGKKSSRRKGGG